MPVEKYWLNSEYQPKINREKRQISAVWWPHSICVKTESQLLIWHWHRSILQAFPQEINFSMGLLTHGKTKKLKQPGNCSLLWALQVKPKKQQSPKLEFSELWITFKERNQPCSLCIRKTFLWKQSWEELLSAGSGSTFGYFRPLRFFCWSREK